MPTVELDWTKIDELGARHLAPGARKTRDLYPIKRKKQRRWDGHPIGEPTAHPRKLPCPNERSPLLLSRSPRWLEPPSPSAAGVSSLSTTYLNTSPSVNPRRSRLRSDSTA